MLVLVIYNLIFHSYGFEKAQELETRNEFDRLKLSFGQIFDQDLEIPNQYLESMKQLEQRMQDSPIWPNSFNDDEFNSSNRGITNLVLQLQQMQNLFMQSNWQSEEMLNLQYGQALSQTIIQMLWDDDGTMEYLSDVNRQKLSEISKLFYLLTNQTFLNPTKRLQILLQCRLENTSKQNFDKFVVKQLYNSTFHLRNISINRVSNIIQNLLPPSNKFVQKRPFLPTFDVQSIKQSYDYFKIQTNPKLVAPQPKIIDWSKVLTYGDISQAYFTKKQSDQNYFIFEQNTITFPSTDPDSISYTYITVRNNMQYPLTVQPLIYVDQDIPTTYQQCTQQGKSKGDEFNSKMVYASSKDWQDYNKCYHFTTQQNISNIENYNPAVSDTQSYAIDQFSLMQKIKRLLGTTQKINLSYFIANNKPQQISPKSSLTIGPIYFKPQYNQDNFKVLLRNNINYVEEIPLQGSIIKQEVKFSQQLREESFKEEVLFDEIFIDVGYQEIMNSGKSKSINYSFERNFVIQNTGESLLDIRAMLIDGLGCKSNAFYLRNCDQGVILYPGQKSELQFSYKTKFLAYQDYSTLIIVTSSQILKVPIFATLHVSELSQMNLLYQQSSELDIQPILNAFIIILQTFSIAIILNVITKLNNPKNNYRVISSIKSQKPQKAINNVIRPPNFKEVKSAPIVQSQAIPKVVEEIKQTPIAITTIKQVQNRVKVRQKPTNNLVQRVKDLVTKQQTRKQEQTIYRGNRYSGSFSSIYSRANSESAVTEPDSSLYSEEEDYYLDDWKQNELFLLQAHLSFEGINDLISQSEILEI